jgi:hypothetical protein
MADYYPLIARAIAGLDPGAPGESRRVLYERARAALVEQMRNADPTLSESDTTRERISLEEAIRRVEKEAAQRAREQVGNSSRLRTSNDQPPEAQASKHPSLLTRDDLERARQRNEQIARQKAEEARRLHDEENRSRVFQKAREEEARLLAEQEEREFRDRRAAVPTINVIPEQNLSRAIGFSATRRGPLDLVSDPPTDPYDVEQSMLYNRIRQQLEKLKEDIPNQERIQVNAAIDDFLSQPKSWNEVEYKKILWLIGNSLRALLAQHDAVQIDPEHYSKLPPSVAEALRNPVQAWSIFVQGDPALAELDVYSLGPQEQQDVINNLVAAKNVVSKASQNREILTERAATALDVALRSASSTSSDVNTKLTQEVADKSSRNLLSAILRKAYLVREAIIDPSSSAAKEIGENVFVGATQAVGYGAMTAVLFAGTHAFPYLEFVATNPQLIKEYIVVAFQNSQMIEIVDAIEFEYRRLKNRL